MARLHLFGLPRLEQERETQMLPTSRGVMLVCVCAIESEVSRDRLVSLLYPDHLETEARTNLRQVLQGLKKKSIGALLEVQANTIRFCGAADVQDFELCFKNADFRGSMSLYNDLMQGINGDNAEIEAWLEEQREKFKRLYHDAVQRETLRLEKLGEYELAWQTLEPLLAKSFAEDLYVQAVRLCMQSGMRSKALELIEDFETRLRAELNLRPLEETRRLFESVRAGTPLELDEKSEAAELPLIGRENQLQQLRKLPPGISLLFGEGGIGKTKLLEMALPSAVWLRCSQASLLPLQPFADWFTALGEKTKVLNVDQIGILEQLSPNSNAPQFTEINQSVLLQNLETALQTFGSTIVLDDLHWADPATLEFLPALSAGLSTSNTRLLIALRPEESLGNVNLEQCLKQLRSLEHFALELHLEALSETDSARLIAAALGLPKPPEAFVSRIYRAAGGHPFFTLEMLRELEANNTLIQDASGAWRTPFDTDTKDYSELQLPTSAINSLERRIRLLPDPERRVLDALAVAGGGSDLGLLERITELNGLALSDALEGLTRVGLVLAGNPRLAHDLMLEATYQMIGDSRRVMLHRLFAGETGSAKHWELAGDTVKASQA
jgi:DNA-binding SARP family transcriptional activator